MNQWINTKDKLPEYWKRVLVVLDDEIYLAYRYADGIGRTQLEYWWIVGHDVDKYLNDIQYWQPLPELPEELH